VRRGRGAQQPNDASETEKQRKTTFPRLTLAHFISPRPLLS
jgi:hypothetical protein